jgi:hypothetical protein
MFAVEFDHVGCGWSWAMAAKYFCDECGAEGNLTRLSVGAQTSAAFGRTLELREYTRELCKSCLQQRTGEAFDFIERLNKQRGE